MNYQLGALYYMWPALVGSAIATIVYFIFSTGPLLRRMLVSSHGGLLLLAGGYALAVSPWSNEYRVAEMYLLPFQILFGLSLILVVYSFFTYRGTRAFVHVLQLVLLPSAAWIWLFGYMTITHEWP
jgi:hypothetical protein